MKENIFEFSTNQWTTKKTRDHRPTNRNEVNEAYRKRRPISQRNDIENNQSTITTQKQPISEQKTWRRLWTKEPITTRETIRLTNHNWRRERIEFRSSSVFFYSIRKIRTKNFREIVPTTKQECAYRNKKRFDKNRNDAYFRFINRKFSSACAWSEYGENRYWIGDDSRLKVPLENEKNNIHRQLKSTSSKSQTINSPRNTWHSRDFHPFGTVKNHVKYIFFIPKRME